MDELELPHDRANLFEARGFKCLRLNKVLEVSGAQSFASAFFLKSCLPSCGGTLAHPKTHSDSG